MRTRRKDNLKRLLSVCTVLALLISIAGVLETTAHAAENDFEEATLSLNSNVVDDSSIAVYLLDSVYYISIDDLCSLTRCSQTFDGTTISVQQGFWSASFDVASQTFDDGYQTVDTSILKVSGNTYAVPALLFLSYYKAVAFIEDDTLYCRMPEYTAWEALDVDYDNSLVDIYELYGGEGNVKVSLTLDILMDFILGDMSSSDDYLSDAFLAALQVDLYDYPSIQKYKEASQNELYKDLHSGEGSDFVEALGDTLSISAEPAEWYIQYYYSAMEKSFVSLAYSAYQAGQPADVAHYGEKFYEAFTEKNRTSEAAEKYFSSMDYVMLFVSAAVETAQEMKYVNATNNLIYDVMGQENLDDLGISAENNDWFTVANRYRNVLGVAATQLEGEAAQLFTDKLCWENLIGTGVSSAAGISGGAWTFSLNFARLFVDHFPLTSSSIEAFDADHRALCLSELQQNVYWIAYNVFLNLQNQLDNPELYNKYVQSLQLYCRTSIAMYENLITMVDEFGQNRDYWMELFQNRIDMLAVSLYQLTTIQEDGVNGCLPMDVSSFQVKSKALSEEELLAITEATANHAMENYVYVDMDHDGDGELIGVYRGDMGLYQTWYCSSDGKTCALVHQNDDGMDACEIELLETGGETHVALNAYRMMGTGKNYSILALQNREIVCLVSNQYGYVSMTDSGDITLNIEAYDGLFDPSNGGLMLHTGKDTYLFFDGNTYKEYGATEISEQDFSSYQNSQALKEAIEGELRQEDTIFLAFTYFRRANGVMHIQCNVFNDSGEIQYGYYTIGYSGNELSTDLGEYNLGQMEPSFSELEVVY